MHSIDLILHARRPVKSCIFDVLPFEVACLVLSFADWCH